VNAHRLQTIARASPQYAVVGMCTEAHAVSHVGILAAADALTHGQTVSVFHMANFRDRLQLPGTMTAHAVGWTHDITADELTRVEDWLQRFKTSSIGVEYWACPAEIVQKDEATGRPIGRKFSCAGFVRCCFAEALRIPLVVRDEDLPEVDVAVLKQAWPFVVDPRAQRYLGGGPGPWRVLLPSYLFHALAGAREALPHRPTRADPCFPP
jgi:hypothetical protein